MHGYQNYIKVQKKIESWMDDVGLSENELKVKLVKLLETKKTVFQKVNGHPESLHHDAFEVAWSHKMPGVDKGKGIEVFDGGETIIGIKVDDREIQRKTLDMAFKIIGMYAPKRELSSKDGKSLQIVTLIPEPLLPEDDRHSPTFSGPKS